MGKTEVKLDGKPLIARPVKESQPRSVQLAHCENELLELMRKYNVSIWEAVSLFERIKFTAMFNEALMSEAKRKKTAGESSSESRMYR